MKTVKLSNSSLDDHLNRLYLEDKTHVDIYNAFIEVVKRYKRYSVVNMSDAAVYEFIEDMQYQTEFNKDSYGTQCRNALRSIEKQTGF
jgi:hypothetical protein